jgi:hypothetical protein
MPTRLECVVVDAAEVARLRALGASRADVGRRAVAWVVLADPEGNELCALGPRGD